MKYFPIYIRNPMFRKQYPYKLAPFRLLAAKLSRNFNQFQAFQRQLAQTFAHLLTISSKLITPKKNLYSPVSCLCPFRIEIGKKMKFGRFAPSSLRRRTS